MSDMKTTTSHDLKGLVLPIAMLLCFAIGYWADMQKLLMRWGNSDNDYCYLILPLFAWLLWEKRAEFDFRAFEWSPWGLVAIFASSFVALLGSLGSVETLVYVGMWGSLTGIALTLYGKRLRTLAFAFIVLLFIVPLPPFVNRMLTFKLKLAASTISVEMLRAVGLSVLQDGNIIDLGVDKLQVVDACSGLRYIMPMVLLSLLIGHFFSRGPWRKLVLLLLVLPLSVILNALRIFLSGVLTVHGYKQLAEGFAHDFAGWLMFMIAAGLLLASAKLLNRTSKTLDSRLRGNDGNSE